MISRTTGIQCFTNSGFTELTGVVLHGQMRQCFVQIKQVLYEHLVKHEIPIEAIGDLLAEE